MASSQSAKDSSAEGTPTKETSKGFNALPPELVLCIADKLDTMSLGRLSQTNGRVNSILSGYLSRAAKKHAFASEEDYAKCIHLNESGNASLSFSFSFYLPTEPIIQAIDNDNVDAVRGYLGSGVSANAYSITGHRLLYTAAAEEAQKVSQLLLDYGADPSLQNLGTTNGPLIMAAISGDNTNVQRLILAGAKVTGQNIIHSICQNCSLDMVKLAIQHGANLYQQSTRGTSVFHDAVINQFIDVLYFLIDAIPELINDPDQQNQTVLWTALSMGNFEAFRVLVDAGINISHRNNHNETIMHDTLCILRETDLPGVLLEQGIKVGFVGQNGLTELHYAAEFGCTDVVSTLLKRGLDANAVDNLGQTPLHRAAKWNYLSVVKVLVEEGNAKLDPRDGSARTPMEYALITLSYETWYYLEAVAQELVTP